MKKKNGFTLIELMVVVAVVAILVAIALPQFLQYFAKARRSEGMVVLKGLFTSEIAYYGTYDSFAFPDGGGTSGIPQSLGTVQGVVTGSPKFYNFTANPQIMQGTMLNAMNIGTFAVDHSTDFYFEAEGQLDTDGMIDKLVVSNVAIPGFCESPAVVCVEPGNDDVLQ